MLHEPQFPRAWFAILRDACLCNLVFAQVHVHVHVHVHVQVHVHGQCMWPKAVPDDRRRRVQVSIAQNATACHNSGGGGGGGVGVQCNACDVEGFTSGYKSMCQFLSLPLLQLQQVAKYDAIMRLDSDSFIHGATHCSCSVQPLPHRCCVLTLGVRLQARCEATRSRNFPRASVPTATSG